MMRYCGFLLCVAVISCLLFSFEGMAFAEKVQDSGGYLAAYQEPVTRTAQTSWWSTFAYLLTLLMVFLFVAGLAYFVSRFLGNKLGTMQTRKSGKILDSLPIGTNRSLIVVEIANKVMLIGVTDQSITLLDEITDELEIARLRENANKESDNEDFQQIFAQQLVSLNRLSKKIPTILKEKKDRS